MLAPNPWTKWALIINLATRHFARSSQLDTDLHGFFPCIMCVHLR